MRVANLADRLVLLVGERAVDVETESGGEFTSDAQAVYGRWDDFVGWATSARLGSGDPFDPSDLRSPAPTPRQVIAVGLNYWDHAAESGFGPTEGEPLVFTKFPSCIVGPYAEVTLPAGGQTDWEVELVAVMGRHAYQVSEQDALSYVAGYAVGQDISERRLQMAATPPQFNLGKSLPGFGPIGPWLVTLDEFLDPNDLALTCAINGEQVQSARTSELIRGVPAVIAILSASMTLLPGDVIFTGTPAGTGLGRSPERWLQPGDEVVSTIEGIGELRNRFRARATTG